MKARARHWVNYNGTWHSAGEVFEIHKADADEMQAYAEIIAEADTECELAADETAAPVAEVPEQTETPEPEETQPRRGRKRKA